MKGHPSPRLIAAVIASTTLALAGDALAQSADDAPAAGAATDAKPADAAAPTEETRSKDDDKKSDDLGLEWVWLNASLGYSYMDIKSAQLAISPAGGSPITVVDSTNGGLAYDFGAGIRLLFLTLGVRAREHTAMGLWQIDAEAAFHGRIGHVDPYLAFRFGYDTVGTLGQSLPLSGTTPPGVSVYGFNGGAALGFDYYFIHQLSIGFEGSGDILYLHRPAASPPALTPAEQQLINSNTPQGAEAKATYQQLTAAYQASASAVGFGAGGFVHLGVHF